MISIKHIFSALQVDWYFIFWNEKYSHWPSLFFQDEEYQATLESYLPSLLGSFRPDLVIFDAGVDPHERDELGHLNLTDQGNILKENPA